MHSSSYLTRITKKGYFLRQPLYRGQLLSINLVVYTVEPPNKGHFKQVPKILTLQSSTKSPLLFTPVVSNKIFAPGYLQSKKDH